MQLTWDRTGQTIEFKYLELFPAKGTVAETRVMYGGDLKHTVELDDPIIVWGQIRTQVLVKESELKRLTQYELL